VLLGVGGIVEVFFLAVLATIVGATLWFVATVGRRARHFGYPSTRAYLRAAPQSDAEKRDAVDMTMKGAVFCLLGAMFGPFILAGLIPLFYGGRKLVYAYMGLGLMDDAEPPRA
jgi:hypothetical protein